MGKILLSKKQISVNNFRNNYYFFDSARAGLTEILKHNNSKILLPSYIGYSINEGSGIFDPVKETKTEYAFYRLNNKLEIDENDFVNKIEIHDPGLILFVHYFGFIDRNFIKLRQLAKSKNIKVIEDCAHAYFTFFNNPSFISDYILFSLHKMFPFNNGGILYSKDVNYFKSKNSNSYDLFAYDTFGISERRRKNYLYLIQNIKHLKKYDIRLLKRYLSNNTPQTFPVLLKSKEDRDYLYFELNNRGIGVVSLYHQLIDEISDDYTMEHSISDRILNLPLHQDISFNDLNIMLSEIDTLMKKNKSRKKQ